MMAHGALWVQTYLLLISMILNKHCYTIFPKLSKPKMVMTYWYLTLCTKYNYKGVFQGYIIGPDIFITFINDMKKHGKVAKYQFEIHIHFDLYWYQTF